MIRDLYFFCYLPSLKLDQYSKFGLEVIESYHTVFNGDKVIHVAVDDLNLNIDHFLASYKIFAGAKIIKVINDEQSCISRYFLSGLNKLKKDSGRMTFIAHLKGSSSGRGQSTLHWINSMYFFNLDPFYLGKVETQIKDKFFCGSLRVTTSCPPFVCTDWHFSGAFYWLNNHKVLNLSFDWYNDKELFEFESFPGKAANLENSYGTFLDDLNYHFNGYELATWYPYIKPSFMGPEIYEKYKNHYNTFAKQIGEMPMNLGLRIKLINYSQELIKRIFNKICRICRVGKMMI